MSSDTVAIIGGGPGGLRAAHAITDIGGNAMRNAQRRVGRGGEEPAECGAVIIATGFTHFDPGRETQMYGYYEFDDVIALQDLEAMLSDHRVARPSNGQPPERVCVIQCVGSPARVRA